MSKLRTLRVLVTRPDPGGASLCERIEQMGEEAIHFPTIVFAPPKDLSGFEQAIAKVGEQNWLIFISPQAVYASVPAIRSSLTPNPSPASGRGELSVQFAAVGAGTAKALKEAGYVAAVYPELNASSEGLLALPQFQAVKQQKIMIVRGDGGRETLNNTLQARGAIVSHLIAYQRVLPQITPPSLPFDVVICTSYEGVRNFKILMGESRWEDIKNIPIIVMSERIKMLALDLDFQTIWVARNASIEAVLEILAERKDELYGRKANAFKE